MAKKSINSLPSTTVSPLIGKRRSVLFWITLITIICGGGLMDNIVSANEKGKIKISKIEDITAEKVEINVHLPLGLDPDTAIEALFVMN